MIIKDQPAYAKASAGKTRCAKASAGEGHPGATGWPKFFCSYGLRYVLAR